jgi:hypothetical protein
MNVSASVKQICPVINEKKVSTHVNSTLMNCLPPSELFTQQLIDSDFSAPLKIRKLKKGKVQQSLGGFSYQSLQLYSLFYCIVTIKFRFIFLLDLLKAQKESLIGRIGRKSYSFTN